MGTDRRTDPGLAPPLGDSTPGLKPRGLVLHRRASDIASSIPQVLELFEAMVEGSRDGLCILTASRVILNSNRVALEILGLRKEDAMGRHVEELNVERGFGWSLLNEVISRHVTVTAIETLRDGRKLLLSGTPIFSADGSLLYLVLTVRDITGIRQVMRRLHETAELSDQYRTALRAAEMRTVQVVDIVARSEPMRRVREKAVQYAAVDSPVLLLGETGTGKGLFARLIHEVSARSAGPFLEVNCGAIPEGLMEAELFGYAKGAFTGADSRGKLGLAELGHRGTLLLNEIGDLPVSLQVKLLRLLEDGQIWPVGAVKPKRPDVRIIAATNRNLSEMMREGTFRADLFYRVNVLTINIPPLREHPEDIPWLVDMMLSMLEQKLDRPRVLAPAALEAISRYGFPGNIRELWNVIERAAVTATTEAIDVAGLPPEISQAASPPIEAGRETGKTLRKALQKIEIQILREALERYGTQTLAAKHLGVSQSTIARKAKHYGLLSDTADS